MNLLTHKHFHFCAGIQNCWQYRLSRDLLYQLGIQENKHNEWSLVVHVCVSKHSTSHTNCWWYTKLLGSKKPGVGPLLVLTSDVWMWLRWSRKKEEEVISRNFPMHKSVLHLFWRNIFLRIVFISWRLSYPIRHYDEQWKCTRKQVEV